ncbi:MAG: Gfo/Idh/MocA family oxidoreductase [Candidatus Margulisbacteria bacterium]|nr:Gfo/Idh/MocA family oxidoreductase [Candidatus Margulisiibacteriota bacterium]MBU1021991.1 Gfo/Idh/MocA family oxidoreductase [Candidatus Margulisiibacteriota bacterium]MBU1728969.1 Gfo/Idh/MocA family oxidoreductase [Candidatus Margulisiibacteriota bacterium]MBU1954775.1 Gfo/Idh/MocA family oxidoreductase [Candidatus Margulisiibacteriota bacterium]
MSEYRKIKIGLIGAGKMGSFHAQKLAAISSVSFKGVYDADQERAKEIAAQYKKKAFTALEDLCNTCEAAVIAAPTETHLEIGLYCLEKGLHLLIEKPLAQNSEDALALVELAEQKQRILAVGHVERFNPAYIALKKLLHKHIILRIDAKRFSPFPERMSAYDVVFDMMIHDIDLALDLSRSMPDTIEGKGKKVKTDQLDVATAKILMQNGILAKLEGSRVEENKVRELVVTLDEHNFVADLQNRKLYKVSLAAPEAAQPFPESEEIPVPDADPLTLEIKDFVRAIRHNAPSQVTGEDGLKAIRIAEAIQQGDYKA